MDCDALVAKIAGRIDSWLVWHLSFAMRLQLISSILFSLQVFWARVFILPKKVIRLIEQKFNRFLWSGKDTKAKAKVAWDKVCFPKSEGGLGLRKLDILKFRDVAKEFLSFKVGKGHDISLWFDAWHPASRLVDNYGFRIVYDFGIGIDAKLAVVLQNGNWIWAPARSKALVNIQSQLPSITIGADDVPVWKSIKVEVRTRVLSSRKLKNISGSLAQQWRL
ncbi:uncharacterized protein LOC133851525 [Alnus glutinosa]|uniref:uncharacterized protein LOC133851525 n=1 Tax=Alnus glutinosa TaxID=3517 RepID=UPI002D79B998|nr:uncharacterized protein LOC133851525 [Alnus glutinosa]